MERRVMSSTNERTVAQAVSEHQDAVITTLALMGALVSMYRDCGCPRCLASELLYKTTRVQLLGDLARSTGADADGLNELVVGAGRRIVKGVPS
jgi:hypothetical protein